MLFDFFIPIKAIVKPLLKASARILSGAEYGSSPPCFFYC